METLAAVLEEIGGPLTFRTLTLGDPAPGEVAVKIAATGVCASDAHTVSGRIPSPLPTVLGHEGAGVVTAVGAGVTHVAAGYHVARPVATPSGPPRARRHKGTTSPRNWSTDGTG